jgi:hypothetical protein
MRPDSYVDDDLSFGVAFAHVIEGLGHPDEFVAAVDYRPYFAFLEQLLKE